MLNADADATTATISAVSDNATTTDSAVLGVHAKTICGNESEGVQPWEDLEEASLQVQSKQEMYKRTAVKSSEVKETFAVVLKVAVVVIKCEYSIT